MVLNLGPLDWKSSILITRPLFMLINLEIYKAKRNSSLDYFWATFFWVPIVLDCYHFRSGCDNVMCYVASLFYGPKLTSLSKSYIW